MGLDRMGACQVHRPRITDPIMPVTYVNRYRDTYYLHVGTTKTGKPRYWFSKKPEGELVESIPEGYEIYENPDAQVFLRKVQPQVITPFEVAVVSRRSISSSTMPSEFLSIWRDSGSVSCRSATGTT
jgi:hypothetical protein